MVSSTNTAAGVRAPLHLSDVVNQAERREVKEQVASVRTLVQPGPNHLAR